MNFRKKLLADTATLENDKFPYYMNNIKKENTAVNKEVQKLLQIGFHEKTLKFIHSKFHKKAKLLSEHEENIKQIQVKIPKIKQPSFLENKNKNENGEDNDNDNTGKNKWKNKNKISTSYKNFIQEENENKEENENEFKLSQESIGIPKTMSVKHINRSDMNYLKNMFTRIDKAYLLSELINNPFADPISKMEQKMNRIKEKYNKNQLNFLQVQSKIKSIQERQKDTDLKD